MIETARQTTCPPQVAYPTFKPIPESLRRPEPCLSFAPVTAFRFVTGLGQRDVPHALCPRLAVVLRRIDAAITAHFARGFAKQPSMRCQAGCSC